MAGPLNGVRSIKAKMAKPILCDISYESMSCPVRLKTQFFEFHTVSDNMLSVATDNDTALLSDNKERMDGLMSVKYFCTRLGVVEWLGLLHWNHGNEGSIKLPCNIAALGITPESTG